MVEWQGRMMGGKVKSILPPGFKRVRKLGGGPAAVVWAVMDDVTGEELALKISTKPDPTRRIQREFAILRRLEHPGIVRVKESREFEGLDYFTMELVDGKPFNGFCESTRKDEGFVELFLDILQKSAIILSDLHQQGIVHIDVKPSNLLVTKDGNPILLDFGFAEDYVLSPTAEPSGTTLDYAAPELFSGGRISPAADIYSLGAMAYEILSGRRLWGGKSPRELIVAKMRTPPGLGKLDVDIPTGIEALILRMLCPDPGLRPSAAEVLFEISWLMKEDGEVVSAPAMVHRLVFGGRDGEMAGLESLVFEEKRVVLLSGSSGIGKTRLLRELRFKALLAGHNVLYIEGRGAYISLVDYLSFTLGITHSEIVPDGQRQSDKWSRYEQVFQGIERSGFDGVYIDAPLDLSEDEKEFLGYLSRGFDTRLGLILSQLPQEVYPQARSVELTPLDEVKVRTIVGRTFGEIKESGRLSDTLANTAKGNPRKMNELLDIFYAEGWLNWKRDWVYEPGKEKKDLTARLEGWLGDTIAKLDKDSRAVLDMLAIAEGPLPGDVIEEIVGESTPIAIVGLANAGLLRSFIYLDRPYYEFGDDVIGPYIYKRLPVDKKKIMGKKLAVVMEGYIIKLWTKDVSKWDSTVLIQLANIFIQTEGPTHSCEYLTEAGFRLAIAGSACDYNKARFLLEKNVDCEISVEKKKKILYELGRIETLNRNPREAEKFYSQILPLTDDNPEEKAKILMLIGKAYRLTRDFLNAEKYLEQSKEFTFASDVESDLLLQLGWLAFYKGNLKDAESFFKKSLETAQPHEKKRYPYHALAGVMLYEGNTEKALEMALLALDMFCEKGEMGVACQTILHITAILENLGRFDEIETYLERAETLNLKFMDPLYSGEILRYKTSFFHSTGRYREALNSAIKATEIFEKINLENLKMDTEFQKACLLMELGDWDRSRQLLLELWKKSIPVNSDNPFIAPILREFARLYHQKGEFIVAQRMIDNAKSFLKSPSDLKQTFMLNTTLFTLDLDQNNLASAKNSLQQCRQLLENKNDILLDYEMELLQMELLLKEARSSEEFKVPFEFTGKIGDQRFKGMTPESYRIWGRVSIALGEYKEGLNKLKESLEIYRTREQPYEQGICLFEITKAMLEHHGYSKEALSYLDEAQTIFERLGAKHYLKRIKDLRIRFEKEVSTKSASAINSLENLGKINELVSTHLGREGFLDSLLTVTLEVTHAERGMILVAFGDELYPITSRAIDSATAYEAERISSTILYQMRMEMKPVYTEDATLDERFNRSESILLNKIRSFICVPLKIGERIMGTIYLDSKLPGLFNASNHVFFETLGNLLTTSIDKSLEFTRLQKKLGLARKKEKLEERGIVICASPVMQKLYQQLEQVAKSEANILIEGETGTGKGVLARITHEQSQRKDKELCSINCGILPENVFESELFGAKKGAFTGADRDRMGLLEAASGSTVFFDEITNTSLVMQAKLLEVIEEKLIRRMGETRKRKVDLRFIFATNRDLKKEVKAGRFREDLYFRISTVRLSVPPLRERKEDVEQFIRFFMGKFSVELNKKIHCVDEEAMGLLRNYTWPGNIRELRNAIERAVLLTTGSRITTEDLELQFASAPGDETSLHGMRSHEEKELILKALAETQGNVSRAARKLDISRRHLYRLMDRHGISP